MKIQWITIQVEDMEISRKFYEEYLGMKKAREFSPAEGMNILFLTTETGMKIELICNYKKKKTEAVPERTPGQNSNVSIGIATDQYEALLRRAGDEGILAAGPSVLGGHLECFFVKDPNGIGIQIIREEKTSA